MQGYSEDLPVLYISEKCEHELSTAVTWCSFLRQEFSTANTPRKKSPEVRLASAQLLRAIQSTGDTEFCHIQGTPQESATSIHETEGLR